MANYVTTWLTIISCAYIFYRIEPMVNAVSWCTTKKSVLIPYVIIVVSILAGTTGAILFCMSGYIPQWHEVFLTGGIAMALLFDRRSIIFREQQSQTPCR